MPDTGAPWNIPYVAGTDLVSDWPTDSLALANAIDAGLDAATVGIGSNVVQTVKSDTFSTTATSYTTVTGLTATITPTTNTSKILLIAQLYLGSAATSHGFIRIAGGNADDYVGDAAGSNRIRTAHVTWDGNSPVIQLYQYGGNNAAIVYLDSPATTSATTYQVEILARSGSTIYVNRSGQDSDSDQYGRTASSLTAIEVKA